jgi:hypothetical protein
MARLLSVLLCALCTIALPAVAAPLPAPPLAVPGGGIAFEVSKTSPQHTSIALHGPEITVDNYTIGYENFRAFSIAGEGAKQEDGSPTVPMVSRFYRIPDTGGADLLITGADYEVMDNVNALPYLPEGTEELRRNSSVYSKDAWYPENVAEMSEPMVMRDFRLVRVILYPVQINPVTHQARIYRNLSVDIVANDRPGENEITFHRRPSRAWDSMYHAYISNLDDGALDDVTTAPGTYMIFTTNNSATRSKADSLAAWKTRCGYKVVLNVQPTNWSSSAMLNLISAAYNNPALANTPLEYVCMMGNPTLGVSDDGGGCDHVFANLTSDDIEDIGVGRLCGNSDAEMAVIMAKIFGYERDPHMESSPGVADTLWFHKACLAACTGASCASNFTLMQWAASEFRQFTGVTNPSVLEITYCPGETECAQQITQGVAFFAWRGTGMESIGGAGTSSTPNWRLPVSICITCGTYDDAQTLVTCGTAQNPKGCVTGVGTYGAGTHNPQNVTVTGGFLYNVADVGVEHVGDAVAGAKAQLYLSSQIYASDFTRWNNLFGDPGLSMWTDVPKKLNVTYPAALNIGDRSVAVTVLLQGSDVPVADATVCLWKKSPDSTWVVGTTDASGHIVLPVSINTSDNLLLTVTKQNHKPYLATIACGQTDCMPMVSFYTLDDDNSGGTHGNNDGILNPGETIDIYAYVKNFGTTSTATGINATMTCANPHVTVINGTTTYPNIAQGDSALGSQPFRIQVSSATQYGEAVQLMLAISSSAGATNGMIELHCTSGDLQYQRHQFTNGNFGPGLTRSLSVTVKNLGTMPLTGVSGHLISLSPFVTVPSADAAYGEIAMSARDSNYTNPFSITAHPLAYAGLQASLLLVLTGDNGFVDSTSFSLPVGSAGAADPTGPDSYGYYAYDNTDANYVLHPTYNYVNISAGLGTNLNLNDTGEKTNTSQIWSTYRVLPFHFTFYGRTYDTLTICANGWVAFGNQAWNDMFRNYTIPAMQAPSAMIAPYWDDLKTSGSGLGVWAYYDADSGRYIVQWKANTTGSSTMLDFEVMLYDSAARPSLDGNGYIVVQYNQIAMNLANNQDNEPSGCTIGIQAPGGTVGLQYAFITTYTPGSATVTNNRAILFTTDATMLSGDLDGHITDAETGQPLSGVIVSTDRYNRKDTTDASGYYQLPNVLIGTYSIMTDRYRFNGDTATGIIIAENETTTHDFSLHHPEMRLSTEAVVDTCQDEPVQTSFTVINDGNGPLDYSSHVFFAGDENATPWDSVGTIRVSQITADPQVWGCEFLYDQWWVTGANGPGGQKVIYRFDRAGNQVGYIPQPATTPLGWFDLATDGRFLYGSDGPGIIKIDTTGQVQGTIPSPLNPTRAVAYDPLMDDFWVADYTSDIYEVDRMGNIVQQVPNQGGNALLITGLAWQATEANGFKLFIFSRNGTTSQIRVSKLNPQTRMIMTVTDLSGLPGDNAAGCTITSGWNSSLVVFGAILRNPVGCRLGIYEMVFDQSWITLSPASATIPGGGSQTVTVSFNPLILRSDTYHVTARLSSAVYDSTFTLPITLVVQRTQSSLPPQHQEVPTRYSLHQNYPNPFNPSTQIRFDLPKAGYVQLKVYNTLGQEVATLVDDVREAGTHTVRWDGRNVASGLYLCRIEAGDFVQVRKMLLMK